MRSYNVTLRDYQILDTRSVHKDTNYITATLSVDGRLIGVPQVKFMGNQNNGTFPVGFVWSDVAVNVEADEILELNYSILNAGHPEHSKLEDAGGSPLRRARTGHPSCCRHQRCPRRRLARTTGRLARSPARTAGPDERRIHVGGRYAAEGGEHGAAAGFGDGVVHTDL